MLPCYNQLAIRLNVPLALTNVWGWIIIKVVGKEGYVLLVQFLFALHLYCRKFFDINWHVLLGVYPLRDFLFQVYLLA